LNKAVVKFPSATRGGKVPFGFFAKPSKLGTIVNGDREVRGFDEGVRPLRNQILSECSIAPPLSQTLLGEWNLEMSHASP